MGFNSWLKGLICPPSSWTSHSVVATLDLVVLLKVLWISAARLILIDANINVAQHFAETFFFEGISYDRLVYNSYMCAYRHSEAYAIVTFRKVRRKSEPIMRMVSCVCVCVCVCVAIYKRVQLKSKLQQAGTWSTVVWSPRILCYRTSVFFRHLIRLCFYSRKENFGAFIKWRLTYLLT
jgi:hypothetical protein